MGSGIRMADATVHQLIPVPSEEEVEKEKNCVKCHHDKKLSDFRPNKRLADGRSNVCYDCHNNSRGVVAGKRNYAVTVKGRYNKAKWVARDRELDFTLTFDQYAVLVSQPCYYCKGRLCGQTRRGVGLDRLRNEIGYVLGNVVSCGGRCNRMKSDWMTPEETLAAVDAILRLRGQR